MTIPVKKSGCVVRAGDRRDATKAFEYMSSQEAQHSVATMSRLLEVSRSGFYAWAERGSSQRACQDLVLSTGIQRIHEYSRGTYGAPRIHAELASEGTHIGCKRVARLMREKGLRGVSRRKWTTTTVRDRAAVLAPDLVKRDFGAQGPESALGGRHHLRSDLGWFPVRRGGRGCLEPSCSGMGLRSCTCGRSWLWRRWRWRFVSVSRGP